MHTVAMLSTNSISVCAVIHVGNLWPIYAEQLPKSGPKLASLMWLSFQYQDK